jgi:hypothetical protein
MPLMPEPWAMAAMLCLIKVFLGFTPMLIPAAIQMVAPPHLRADGALFLLSTGLLGTSCGPLLRRTGATLFPGTEGLRLSLCLSAGIMMPLAMAALLWGRRSFAWRWSAGPHRRRVKVAPRCAAGRSCRAPAKCIDHRWHRPPRCRWRNPDGHWWCSAHRSN